MSEISAPTGKLLALSRLKGVGPASLRKISTYPQFLSSHPDDWALLVPQIARAIEAPGAWERALEEAEQQVSCAEGMGAQILSPLDASYPRLLAATKDDPFLLYVRGSLAADPSKSVAVIGTREPTAHGAIIAARVTRFFVDQQWSIVSGLALGCDTIAHEAAVESGGHTMAVLAHGLQTVAPARNRGLADRILEAGGALVTEYPFGQEPLPQQFVRRDRTQAGLAQGVVMIQSDLLGGSLHATRAAIDYGRWLAVPYPTEQDLSSGEPKVQANLVLTDGTPERRAELLKQLVNKPVRVITLRGREDYGLMLKEGLSELSAASPVPQGALL